MSALPERAVIPIASLTAVVECHAWEDDPEQRSRKRLWALGSVGTYQVLEAVWADLFQGSEAGLLGGGHFGALALLGAGMWTSQVAALNEASGAHRTATPAEAVGTRSVEVCRLGPSSAARVPAMASRPIGRQRSSVAHCDRG